MIVVNVDDLIKDMATVVYPASKQELLTNAKERHLSESVQALLQRLPEKRYDSPGDVVQTIAALDQEKNSASGMR